MSARKGVSMRRGRSGPVKPLYVHVPAALKSQLDAARDRYRVPLSELVEAAIGRYLDGLPQDPASLFDVDAAPTGRDDPVAQLSATSAR